MLVASVLLAVGVHSQDRMEIGLMGGVGYYLGDLNPSQQFKNPGPSVAGIVRYVVTDRAAVKVTGGVTMISGSYGEKSLDRYSPTEVVPHIGAMGEDETEVIRPGEMEFKNTIVDICAMGELNFMSFDHIFRKDQTKFTPYLTLGLGASSYLAERDGAKKRVFVLSLPFGAGIRWKVTKALRIGAEWTFHKTMADDLEYVEPGERPFDASDPYKNNVHVMTHNNDWYSALRVMVTFSMWPRSLVCNDGLRTYYRE